MDEYFAQKKERENAKVTNYRSWKSGKQWLYASSLLIGLTAAGTMITDTTVASADTDTPASVASSSNAAHLDPVSNFDNEYQIDENISSAFLSIESANSLTINSKKQADVAERAIWAVGTQLRHTRSDVDSATLSTLSSAATIVSSASTSLETTISGAYSANYTASLIQNKAKKALQLARTADTLASSAVGLDNPSLANLFGQVSKSLMAEGSSAATSLLTIESTAKALQQSAQETISYTDSATNIAMQLLSGFGTTTGLKVASPVATNYYLQLNQIVAVAENQIISNSKYAAYENSCVTSAAGQIAIYNQAGWIPASVATEATARVAQAKLASSSLANLKFENDRSSANSMFYRIDETNSLISTMTSCAHSAMDAGNKSLAVIFAGNTYTLAADLARTDKQFTSIASVAASKAAVANRNTDFLYSTAQWLTSAANIDLSKVAAPAAIMSVASNTATTAASTAATCNTWVQSTAAEVNHYSVDNQVISYQCMALGAQQLASQHASMAAVAPSDQLNPTQSAAMKAMHQAQLASSFAQIASDTVKQFDSYNHPVYYYGGVGAWQYSLTDGTLAYATGL